MSASEEIQGEIASLAEGPLHTGRLDDYANVAASVEAGGYGDDADERAIKRILRQLRSKSSSRTLSADQLTEKAESLYVMLCNQVTAGVADEQLAKIAELFGEQPAKLQARLS